MSGNGLNSYERFLPFLRRDPETAKLIGGTSARQQALHPHSTGAGGSSGVPMSRRGEEPGLPLSTSSTSLTMPPGAHSSHANGFWQSGQKSLLELKRFASPKGSWYIYWADMYHTMLNMPRYRFIVVFFATYVMLYILFALLYLTQPDHCVGGTMAFSHALWFSVQTAATLGYTSQLAPNIDCTAINILVLLEVIAASLLDYCMMGIVFARFATPVNRAQTIRFSKQAVLCKQESGFWGLSFRMANIRKHSLLQPELSLLLAVPDNSNASAFQFVALEIDNLVTQVANLKLGLPATVTHIVRPSSPLFELSLDEMQQRSIHIVCFMDGIDPMTSNSIQSRYSYMPSDIRMNERFTTIGLQQKGGKLGLDLTNFDGTVAAAFHAGMDGDDPDSYLYPVPEPSTTTPETMRDHMATLRSKSIRTLTAVGAGSIEALPLMASRDRDAALGVLCDAVLTDSLASSELRRTAASIKEQLAVMS